MKKSHASLIVTIGKGKGKSMEPIINEGDSLILQKISPLSMRIGYIIVFRQKNRYVGHRVIKIGKVVVTTKGDNLSYPDLPVRYKDVLGRVILIRGKYGSIDLTSSLSRVISFYFLLYSLSIYYIPLYIQKTLVKLLRGRKILLLISRQSRK